MNAISSTQGRPPEPVYILRGHASAVNSLLFLRGNLRLLSGDSSGFIVLWDLTIKRPTAVWKAHGEGIIGIDGWTDGRILTQGRDGKIRVWSLTPSDEEMAGFSTILPVQDANVDRRSPWLLHELDVGTLNFCSMAVCRLSPLAGGTGEAEDRLIIAIAGSKDSEIDLRILPSEETFGLIPAPKSQGTAQAGMVMALAIFRNEDALHVVAGYENGQAAVFRQVHDAGQWTQVYSSRPHEQPILSLSAQAEQKVFFTSGADAVVAKHAFDHGDAPARVAKTKHAGQQGLRIRDDGKIFATAGWDHMLRVYSCKTMKEVAVLAWHKIGCYAVAFAAVDAKHGEESRDLVASSRSTVAQAREEHTRGTHWIAAGAKDGKISLWDIY